LEEIVSPGGSSAYAWVWSISIAVVVSIVTALVSSSSSSSSSSIIFFGCDDETISSWSSLFNCVDSITNGTVADNVVAPITKLPSSWSSFDIDDDDGGINDEDLFDEDSFKPFCFDVTSSESVKRKIRNEEE
jgi:hypothetical protein